MTARLAVLASGGGSNLQAILDYFGALGSASPARVVLVASDRPDAGALLRARERGVPTATIRTRRNPDGAPLAELLGREHPDFVVLAGYLRLVPPEVVRAYAGRIVNVHPALLPQFGGAGMYGHHVHEAVIAAHAAESGPTVHLVDEHFDHGAHLVQWAIPVRAGDTADGLAARVLRVEHIIFPRALHALVSGTIRAGQRPIVGHSSGPDDPNLIEEIEHALGL